MNRRALVENAALGFWIAIALCLFALWVLG